MPSVIEKTTDQPCTDNYAKLQRSRVPERTLASVIIRNQHPSQTPQASTWLYALGV